MQEILKYQEIDMKLKRIHNQLVSSQNRKGVSLMQTQMAELKNTLIKLDARAKALIGDYQKAKKLYEEFVSKLELLEKSISEADADQAAKLKAKVSSFIATSESLEEGLSATQTQILSLNKDIAGVSCKIKETKDKIDAYQAAFNEERNKLAPDVKKLEQELSVQATKVKPELMAKYKAKCESRNKYPIFVPENKGRCGGCGMEIPAGRLAQLQTRGMIECENENCTRIIYKV